MSEITYSQHFHRQQFLDAIASVNPKVLATLFQDCYLAFLKLTAVYDLTDAKAFEYHTRRGRISYGLTSSRALSVAISNVEDGSLALIGLALEELDLKTDDGKAFLAVIKTWSARFNLGDDWILDSAVSTLLESAKRGVVSDKLRLARRWLMSVPLKTGVKIELEWRLGESRASVEKKLLAEAKAQLNAIETAFEEVGFDPENRKNGDRFRWLAMYQTMGKSPQQIRIAEVKNGRSVTDSAIMQGYKTAAEACNITLRQGTRGPTRVEI